jgi:hypothetical protein
VPYVDGKILSRRCEFNARTAAYLRVEDTDLSEIVDDTLAKLD